MMSFAHPLFLHISGRLLTLCNSSQLMVQVEGIFALSTMLQRPSKTILTAQLDLRSSSRRIETNAGESLFEQLKASAILLD